MSTNLVYRPAPAMIPDRNIMPHRVTITIQPITTRPSMVSTTVLIMITGMIVVMIMMINQTVNATTGMTMIGLRVITFTMMIMTAGAVIL